MAVAARLLFALARLVQVVLAPYLLFLVRFTLRERFDPLPSGTNDRPHPPAPAERLDLLLLLAPVVAGVLTLTLPALDVVSVRHARTMRSRSLAAVRRLFDEGLIVLWLLATVGAVVTIDPGYFASLPLVGLCMVELLLFVLSAWALDADARDDAADGCCGARCSAEKPVVLPADPHSPTRPLPQSFQSGDIALPTAPC